MIKFKEIFDSKLRTGDAVISRATDETFIFVQEYEPGLTSMVKYPTGTDRYFLIETRLLAKFRGYIFCQWIGERVSKFNKRLSRIYAAAH